MKTNAIQYHQNNINIIAKVISDFRQRLITVSGNAKMKLQQGSSEISTLITQNIGIQI